LLENDDEFGFVIPTLKEKHFVLYVYRFLEEALVKFKQVGNDSCIMEKI